VAYQKSMPACFTGQACFFNGKGEYSLFLPLLSRLAQMEQLSEGLQGIREALVVRQEGRLRLPEVN
jgi:hypothetical protein